MMPGPTLIRQCPHCRRPFAQWTLASGNTLGAAFYTDGAVNASMLPATPPLVRCPACAGLIWLEDARVLAECEPGHSDADWPGVQVAEGPDADGYLDALERGMGADPGRAGTLRRHAWWRWSDPAREAASDPGSAEHRASAVPDRLRPHLEALLASADLSGEWGRLEAAELARQLGRFGEALGLLSVPFSEECRHRARVIADRAAAGDTRLWPVRGDEGLTDQERREIEAAAARYRAEAAERRRREEAEFLRLRAEQAAALEQRLGDFRAGRYRGPRCPRCEFSYGWDGTRCGHCRFPERLP